MLYRARIMTIEAFEFDPSKPFPIHFQPNLESHSGIKVGDLVCKDQKGRYFVLSKEMFETTYEPAERKISAFEMNGNW